MYTVEHRPRSVTPLGLATALVTGVFLLAPPAAAMSPEDEVRIGKQVMAQVRHFGLTRDPSLDAIGQRLAPAMKRQDVQWQLFVVEGMKEYNAFAAPGGFVFITRGYYEKLNDDEAAFAIGHEMAHVDLHHVEKQIKRGRQADIGRILIGILTNSSTVSTAADIGATAYTTHYSRVLERDADFAGYAYAEQAGYDARAAVTALSKLGSEPKLHPWIVSVYATHPVLSSREDRLAALGGKEPEEIKPPPPSASHARDLTAGLRPFEPKVPIAVRILSPDGARWENPWRKSFTKLLHEHLRPLGFEIAGDDIMYKPDIGDPLAAARSRNAQHLLLVTVSRMDTKAAGKSDLYGVPVQANVAVAAKLIRVADGGVAWEGKLAHQAEGRDVLAADPEILYPDTTLGRLAEQTAGETAIACAKAAGAKPAAK
jgi:Zn-dependent protease with chaperone function